MDEATTGRGSETDLSVYAPRVLAPWLSEQDGPRWRQVTGTLVFVDVSGFTQLSERLARYGDLGAEELTDTINVCVTALLDVADKHGGNLLKFGGDALLLLFTGAGHITRGCRAAVGMQAALGELGALETSDGPVEVSMSVGVHSGELHLFLVGSSHRELVVTGPAATTVVEALAQAIPLALRQYLASSHRDAEHRVVTVAFLRFRGTDALLAEEGPEATAAALEELVRAVQEAADHRGGTFLASYVDADGGKLILVAGAPASGGNDAERMLLALTDIAAQPTRLGLQVAVDTGPVFVGDVGPTYRRAYTVMGDAVNLAARVMGRSLPRAVLATEAVVAASRTLFVTDPLAPVAVKGKSAPVRAVRVGAVRGTRADEGRTEELPFTGRAEELARVDQALQELAPGAGRLIEVLGEPGIGTSRLLRVIRERSTGREVVELVCELHRATVPYGNIRKLLREQLGAPTDASETEAAEHLLTVLDQDLPHLRELGAAAGAGLRHAPARHRRDPRPGRAVRASPAARAGSGAADLGTCGVRRRWWRCGAYRPAARAHRSARRVRPRRPVSGVGVPCASRAPWAPLLEGVETCGPTGEEHYARGIGTTPGTTGARDMTVALTVLGSAGSHTGAGRMCSGYLLEADGLTLLLDAGNGATANLQRTHSLGDLDAIVISHRHVDHCIDLIGCYYNLRFDPTFDGRMPLYAAAEVHSLLTGMLSNDAPMAFDDLFVHHQVGHGDEVVIGPARLRFARSIHPVPTVSTRIEVEGGTVVYSGDSAGGPDLVEIARGADLFLCEATWAGDPAQYPPDIHLTGTQAGQVAAEAGVGQLILTHIAGATDRAEVLAEAGAAFDGPVLLAEDLERYEVTAGV